jgi:hypothetical protein
MIFMAMKSQIEVVLIRGYFEFAGWKSIYNIVSIMPKNTQKEVCRFMTGV